MPAVWERLRSAEWAAMSFRVGLFVVLIALFQASGEGIERTLAGVLLGLVLIGPGLFCLLTSTPQRLVQLCSAPGQITEVPAPQDNDSLEELIRVVDQVLVAQV